MATIYDIESRLFRIDEGAAYPADLALLSRRAIMAYVSIAMMWCHSPNWIEGEPPPHTMLRDRGSLLVMLLKFDESYEQR